MPYPHVVLEACCASVEEAVAAFEAGADRVELCAGLPTGGVTPSPGSIEEAKSLVSIPIVAMIRPKEGRPQMSDADYRSTLRDVKHMLRAGADELIVGVLDDQGRIDRVRNRAYIDAAEGRPVAFHRVFDMTPNLEESLDTLIELGFARVLTSGGALDVENGLPSLSRLVMQAGDRITVLAGGGVRPHNARKLVEAGCRELHFSIRKPSGFGGYQGLDDTVPDPERIRQMRAAVVS